MACFNSIISSNTVKPAQNRSKMHKKSFQNAPIKKNFRTLKTALKCSKTSSQIIWSGNFKWQVQLKLCVQNFPFRYWPWSCFITHHICQKLFENHQKNTLNLSKSTQTRQQKSKIPKRLRPKNRRNSIIWGLNYVQTLRRLKINWRELHEAGFKKARALHHQSPPV